MPKLKMSRIQCVPKIIQDNYGVLYFLDISVGLAYGKYYVRYKTFDGETYKSTSFYDNIEDALEEVLTWDECKCDSVKLSNDTIKYILVEWPDSQYLMDHLNFKDECILVDSESSGYSSAYMCPEKMYHEIFDVRDYESKNKEEAKRIY